MADVKTKMSLIEILQKGRIKIDDSTYTGIAKEVNEIEGCNVSRHWVRAMLEGSSQTSKNVAALFDVVMKNSVIKIE